MMIVFILILPKIKVKEEKKFKINSINVKKAKFRKELSNIIILINGRMKNNLIIKLVHSLNFHKMIGKKCIMQVHYNNKIMKANNKSFVVILKEDLNNTMVITEILIPNQAVNLIIPIIKHFNNLTINIITDNSTIM